MKVRATCATLPPLEEGESAIRLAPGIALALAFALWLGPVNSHAGFRGAFDPLTVDSGIFNRCEFPTLRPFPAANGLERFFSFTTRSAAPGREGSREIWLHRNVARAGIALPIDEARLPLLRDPTGTVSYLDPAWSPDGRFLAYVRTDAVGNSPAIYVQEFQLSETIAEAVTPIGSPILVAPGISGGINRRPDWSPDGNSLVYESTATGISLDLYTVTVFPAVGTAVRRTFDDGFAEQSPAWSPDGHRIAYMTNILGPFQIAVVDLATPSPHAWALIEPLAPPIHHSAPDWSSDGLSIYYHAPKNEDERLLPDIWKLELNSLVKCGISMDLTSDSEVDVSNYVHTSPDGIPFNYFFFTSMAGIDATFRGPHTWRGQHIYNCVVPLSMAVQVSPSTIQLGSSGQNVSATLTFPPETIAAGYQCSSFDGPLEGVRMRNTVLASPTMEGLPAKPDPATGNVFPIFVDKRVGNALAIEVTWNRKDLEALLLNRGLLGKNAPLQIDAYSNGVGRRFRGFGYIKLTAPESTTSTTSEITLESSAPNPFNPVTRLHFAIASEGRATVRIFNARGQLVRTVAKGWFAQGRHEVTWDGRDDRGGNVPSGVYYAHAAAESGVSDRLKLVLMR